MIFERPVIASNLGEAVDHLIANHACKPRIIPMRNGNSWEPPPEATILLTYASPWKNAPSNPPVDWPRRLDWIQTGSAGLDGFPSWMFQVPMITSSRGVLSAPIAEYVMGVVIGHEKRLWSFDITGPDDWMKSRVGGLSGKTIGIAGFGTIGAEIAIRARSFGIKILALTRTSQIDMPDVTPVADMADLIARSDHLVLTLPLTDTTRHIINADILRAAKSGVHIINVGRGGLIDDVALIKALDRDATACATLDVTWPEPLPAGHLFYAHPRIRLTPHISGMSENAEARLADKILDNLDRFLEGRPLLDQIDISRGY